MSESTEGFLLTFFLYAAEIKLSPSLTCFPDGALMKQATLIRHPTLSHNPVYIFTHLSLSIQRNAKANAVLVVEPSLLSCPFREVSTILEKSIETNRREGKDH